MFFLLAKTIRCKIKKTNKIQPTQEENMEQGYLVSDDDDDYDCDCDCGETIVYFNETGTIKTGLRETYPKKRIIRDTGTALRLGKKIGSRY